MNLLSNCQQIYFLVDKNSLQNSSTNRRDFLKYLGFSTAAATLASCEGPVNRSIPYVVQPERIIPGICKLLCYFNSGWI